MKIAQFLLFGGFWLVVLDPQKSNRAKNCCTCLQYGKAPSNIDLVPTPEIATIFLKPRDSPSFVLQIVAAITPCVKTSLGGSRKYPYPYHGRHLGIPKGRGGYVDWNSEDMGGFIGLEFRRHGGIFRRVTSSLV